MKSGIRLTCPQCAWSIYGETYLNVSTLYINWKKKWRTKSKANVECMKNV